MSVQDILFMGVAGITLLGGLFAVGPRNVFTNAMSLILCLFGVAGLFIFLNCEFLAIVEVIIYIGAISIAIIFAIMLSKPWPRRYQPRRVPKVLRSLLGAGLLFWGLTLTLRNAAWLTASEEGDYSLRVLGRSLIGEYALPFEVVSLVLLIAIVGALVVSSSKESS